MEYYQKASVYSVVRKKKFNLELLEANAYDRGLQIMTYLSVIHQV